jgi:glycogen operon protein
MQNIVYKHKPGQTYPTGAKKNSGGVNFSIFGRHATCVELLLFERPDSKKPFQIIKLDENIHKTFYSWHVYVIDLPIGTW